MTAPTFASYLRHAHYVRAREVRPGDVTNIGVVVELLDPPRTLFGCTCIAAKTAEGDVVVDTLLLDAWVPLLAMVSPSDRGVPPWDVR